MVKRLTMLLASLFLVMGVALAQTQVSGYVTSSEDGEPVIGASIKVVGTSTGTVTDVDGKFSLSVSNDAKLQVSYIGMMTKTVKATENMKIVLDPDNKTLDEVMVVAYGTQKKSSFTGSAATVKGDKLEKLQVSNLSKGLDGAIAGVTTSSTSGTPGSSANIIVRGIGSISSSQSPLIVVDGVPYEGSLNSISTQDIESLTVLKDAAANSMYGARGANGVIMITTKGSKASKTVVNFDARLGFNARSVGNYDVVTDPGQYYEMMFDSYRNSLLGSMSADEASQYAAKNLITKVLKYNIYKDVADDAVIDAATGKLNSAATTRKWSDDWTKDPFENGLRHEYNANVSSGSESTHAYMSLGYLGDKGYMVGSDFNRVNARVKVDHKIGKFVKIGANLAYAKTKMNQFSNSTKSNYSNIFMFSQSIAPIYPIYLYDADGNVMLDENGNRRYDFGTEYARPYGSQQNPLAVAQSSIYQTNRDNITSRGYIEVNFLNDFKFTANVAYDVFNTNYTNFMTPIGGDAANVGGRGYQGFQRYGALNVNQILDWNHDFGKHNVHLMLVHENKQDKNHDMDGQMTGFSDYSNPDFSNASLYQDLTSYSSEYALEGYLLKGEWGYNDTYYLTASVRRDGSSRFYKDNRWGTFWAVGGAWRVDKEEFFKPLQHVVNSFKLKASYGTQGNDNIGMAHAYSDLYTVSRLAGGAAAFTKTFRGNKELTWEKQAMFNVGFEAGLLNRVSFNFDFFVKNNNDMLFKSPLAKSEGSPNYIWRNEVNMRNTGFEAEVNVDIIKNKNVNWSAGLNVSHYKNELTKLPASKPASEYPDGFQRGDYWWNLGQSIYNFSGYEYVGVDKETGEPQYNKYVTDANGNTTVEIVNSEADATLVNLNKSAIPDLTGGFNTSLTAYGFDFSVQTSFQLGGWVKDSFYASLMTTGGNGNNFHKDMANHWTPENTETNIPKLVYNSNNAGISSSSDFFLTKASYFSLKNVTLGYTIPSTVTNAWGISRLRVYLAGDNVWLLSKRKGLDPRQNFDGTTGYGYSALSSYSFGINLTF